MKYPKNRLEIDSVQLDFGGRRVPSDVYLSLEKGQITGILGRNGSGKSCLMKLLFGIQPAQNASVRFNGAYLKKAFQYQGLVGYFPQHHFVPGGMSLQKAVSFFVAEQHGNVFRSFVQGDTNQKMEHFSGGQRRFLELLLLLLSDKQFLLLDEPFSHISPVQMELIQEVIHQHCQDKGLLITDHLYKSILELCDPVYVLKDHSLHQVDLLEKENSLAGLGYLLI